MLFDITLRVIVEQSLEILNVSTMIYTFSLWMRSTLCHGQVIKWAKARVHVYSDSVLCLGNAHDPSEANDQMIPTIQRVRRVVCGEPIEFECNICQGFTLIEILRKIPGRSGTTNKSRTIWGKNSIRANVQWHWLDREWTFIGLYFEFQSRRLREKISARTLVIPRFWKWTKNVLERTLIKHKENVTMKPIRCWIPYSEVQVRSSEESWGEKQEEIRYTSQRNRQTLNFYFGQSTRHLSSVCTEQHRLGVMSWLKGCLVRHPCKWTNSFQKWVISNRNSLIRKKLVLWCRTKRGQRKPLGNSWCDHPQRFKILDLDDQFRTICESAGSQAEWRYKDPEYSSGSLARADDGSMKETHA